MGYVISAYLKRDLIKLSYSERKLKVGIVEGEQIISPPRCPRCGAYCIRVEMDGRYLQCSECLQVYKEYRYKGISLGELYGTSDESKRGDGGKDS